MDRVLGQNILSYPKSIQHILEVYFSCLNDCRYFPTIVDLLSNRMVPPTPLDFYFKSESDSTNPLIEKNIKIQRKKHNLESARRHSQQPKYCHIL